MKSAIPLVVAAALLAGCGSDDEEAPTAPSTSPRDGADNRETEVETAVLRSPAIGFTFKYPRDLPVEKRPRKRSDPTRVLVEVAAADNPRFNSVKVRLTSEQEFRPERYLKTFQRQFAEQAEGEVEAHEERIGRLDTAIIEFDRSFRGVEFRTTSYFFTGAGRTWQIECVSEPDYRQAVGEVCRMALESVRFRKPRKKPARGAKQVG